MGRDVVGAGRRIVNKKQGEEGDRAGRSQDKGISVHASNRMRRREWADEKVAGKGREGEKLVLLE